MSAIKINSQNIYKELSASPVNFLLANVGDKIRIETIFSVNTFCVGSTDSPFTLNATDGYIGTGWLKGFEDCFKDFKVGDGVKYYNQGSGASATFTIIDKLSDFEIRLNTTFSGVSNNTEKGDAVFSITTPISAVKYFFNFVENDAPETFLSPVDGSEQIMIVENQLATNTSPTQMEFLGKKTWQQGVATIEGVSEGLVSGVWTSKYKIIHFLQVTPFILYNAPAIPVDFQELKCWKFIYRIDAMESYKNPNYIVSTSFQSVLGNSGFYGENYNTGLTNYSISDIVYVNNNKIVDSVVLGNSETTITFNVNNATDTPFSNHNTEMVIGMFKVPADPSEYQDTNKVMNENFLYDRAFQKLGEAKVDGDNFGTDYQILKDIKAEYVSSSVMKITAKISMANTVLESFQESSLPKYYIYISTQDYTLDTSDAANDLVSLTVAESEFAVVTSDETMIVCENVFIRHPESDPSTQGISSSIAKKATLKYRTNNWVRGTCTSISITASFNFLIGGSYGFSTPSLNPVSLDDLLDNIVAQILLADATTNASYNRITKEFSLQYPASLPDNGNGYELTGWGGSFSPTAPPILDAVSDADFFFSGGSDLIEFNVFPQDEIVACSNFYIESAGRGSDEIKLSSINAKIIASDGTKEFELDQFIMQLSAYPLVGYTQQFDAQVARAFHIPVGTIRKYIEVKRRNDLDAGTRKYFSSNYPFLFRWETWTAALGVDSSFFNASLPNNGFNEWWFHYQSGDWKLYYKLIVNATKNGEAQRYTLQQPITPHDYASNSLFTTKDTLPFDPADLALLLSGTGGAKQLVSGESTYVTINGQKYYTNGEDHIFSYQKTLIAAIFTKTTAPVNVTVEIDAEVFEQGGISGKRRFSSKWVADSDTWFSSIDDSGKVAVYDYGNSVIALCYLDPSTGNFPANATAFSLSSRIYETGLLLTTDDEVPLTTDGGVQIEID